VSILKDISFLKLIIESLKLDFMVFLDCPDFCNVVMLDIFYTFIELQKYYQGLFLFYLFHYRHSMRNGIRQKFKKISFLDTNFGI